MQSLRVSRSPTWAVSVSAGRSFVPYLSQLSKWLCAALKDISDPLGFLLPCVDARSVGRPGRQADMAQIPGVTVEQIEQACRIAAQLNRGKLCLVEKPSGWQPPEDDA
jgi:hypothetical protein